MESKGQYYFNHIKKGAILGAGTGALLGLMILLTVLIAGGGFQILCLIIPAIITFWLGALAGFIAAADSSDSWKDKTIAYCRLNH